MSHTLFILGTDTGVGKTLITATLAAYLKQQGHSVAVMKPFESGCQRKAEAPSELIRADAEFLKQISDSSLSLDKINPYFFEAPLSPYAAASLENQPILFSKIQEIYQEMTQNHSIVLIEGAGGLLVPLILKKTFLELIKLLKVPVLLVAANKLGTLNHTLLTLYCLQKENIPIAGLILNQTHLSHDQSAESNASVLQDFCNIPLWENFQYLDNLQESSNLLGAMSPTFKQSVDRFFSKSKIL